MWHLIQPSHTYVKKGEYRHGTFDMVEYGDSHKAFNDPARQNKENKDCRSKRGPEFGQSYELAGMHFSPVFFSRPPKKSGKPLLI